MCVNGAQVVRQHILETITDPRLRVYVVWEPILGADTPEAAERAAEHLPQARVTHFWAADLDLGRAFSPVLGLGKQAAWDVYLLYGSDAGWGSSVPRPDYVMHQLRSHLPPETCLDGPKLATEIRKLLGRAAPGRQ